MKNVWKVVSYCVGPAVILLGVFISNQENRVTEGLVRSNGTILSSEIREEKSGQGMKTYHPEISYSYRVQGREYISKKVALNSVVFETKMEAERVTARYQPGNAVQIYYDRNDHSRAFLETGSVGNGGLTVALGILLTLIIIPLIFMVNRKRAAAGIALRNDS